MTKPKLDQGADYERGFVDGMSKQAQSSVDKAVNAMSQRTWVGLTKEELCEIVGVSTNDSDWNVYKVQEWLRKLEAKLRSKNNG